MLYMHILKIYSFVEIQSQFTISISSTFQSADKSIWLWWGEGVLLLTDSMSQCMCHH